MRTNKLSQGLLIKAILMSLSPSIFAADYAAGFNMTAGTSHNDNIRMVQRDKIAVRKIAASPTLTFGAATETSELKLDSTFDFNRYDEDEFDSDDQSATLLLSHQFEKSSIGLNAAYINNTTITSELLTSGIIGQKADRAEQYQLSPEWRYNINETHLLQIQAFYTSQNYESDSYIGYKNTGVQIDWIYKISERMSWVTAATYSDYKSDDVSVDVPRNSIFGIPQGNFGEQSYSVGTKSKGINIGLNYEWSERTSLEARLGRSKNYTTYPVKDPENICSRLIDNGLTAEFIDQAFGTFCLPIPAADAYSSTAGLTWQWQNERHQISLNGTKETQPTSNGYAVDAIQMSANWNYLLTELDQFSTVVTLVRNRAIDDKSALQNASNADRDYGAGTFAYQRQLNESWFLRASYQFAKQKYTETDNEANSNTWALNLTYRPQQWHWAR